MLSSLIITMMMACACAQRGDIFNVDPFTGNKRSICRIEGNAVGEAQGVLRSLQFTEIPAVLCLADQDLGWKSSILMGSSTGNCGMGSTVMNNRPHHVYDSFLL